jgi:AcrR family transcriptional regulator
MTVRDAAVRGADVEQAALDAARDLLASGGLEGLSMRSVAERVGVSATALYRYFENKEALIGRVVQRGFRQFGDYLQAAADQYPRGSMERVRALGEAYLGFAIENQSYFRVLFSIHHGGRHTLDDLPEGGGYGLLRQAVVDAIAAGSIRRADPDHVVMFLWSLTHGLLTISMACNIEHCPEFGPETVSRSPADLFRAFGLFVQHGIAPDNVDGEERDGAKGGSA